MFLWNENRKSEIMVLSFLNKMCTDDANFKKLSVGLWLDCDNHSAVKAAICNFCLSIYNLCFKHSIVG